MGREHAGVDAGWKYLLYNFPGPPWLVIQCCPDLVIWSEVTWMKNDRYFQGLSVVHSKVVIHKMGTYRADKRRLDDMLKLQPKVE